VITNISLITLWVTNQDAARDFYTSKLGFTAKDDVKLGDGFRWVTITHPAQPELEVTLMVPGPPLDPDMAEAVERSLAKGKMGGFGLRTDDCQKMYDELSAQGVEFPQSPAKRPYGVEAVMRDNSGNWLVLVEPSDYTAEDFANANGAQGAVPEASAR
jgi:catechol 2,3-dioxygenase-like lactoylglutathione lyase family enzyme